MTASQVSTHVLDTATGRPAVGVSVTLEGQAQDAAAQDPAAHIPAAWAAIASGVTDDNGRVGDLGPAELATGSYRLRFDTGAYFARSETETFFPEVTLTFTIAHREQHYHVPLLISPFAYSTYRGN